MAAITVEQRGAVLLARLDSPPHALLVPELVDRIDVLVDRAESDRDVRAVVLIGTHPERFIAHADVQWLQEGAARVPSIGRRGIALADGALAGLRGWRPLAAVLERTPVRGMSQLDRFHRTLLRMNRCGAVFVAALNGSALGGGLELALACDLRIMSEGDFVLGQPEVLLGFPPGGGGTQRLARLVGVHRALHLVLEGRGISPEEALEAGLVDEVVPASSLAEVAIARAEHLGARDKVAVAACKRAVYEGGSASLPEGLHRERVEFLTALGGPRAQAVARAFQADTERSGTLPTYDPGSYALAWRTGSFPATAGTVPPDRA